MAFSAMLRCAPNASTLVLIRVDMVLVGLLCLYVGADPQHRLLDTLGESVDAPSTPPLYGGSIVGEVARHRVGPLSRRRVQTTRARALHRRVPREIRPGCRRRGSCQHLARFHTARGLARRVSG